MALTVKNALKLAEKYVANTAKRLDKDVPGWEGRINTKNLVMEKGSKCICGQLGVGSPYNDISFEQGFWWYSDKHKLPTELTMVGNLRRREEILKNLWIKEIDQRLAV